MYQARSILRIRVIEQRQVHVDQMVIDGAFGLPGGPGCIKYADEFVRPSLDSEIVVVQVAGNLIYVNPLMIDRGRETPFKLKARKFPVDMAYARNFSTTVSITLPPGYEVKETPLDRTIGLPNNDANYSRRIEVQGNIIRLVSKFRVTRVEFPSTMYMKLKDFYQQVIALQNDQIVLEKKVSGKK